MFHRKTYAPFSVLASVLTLAASGDDFNVCRLAFPLTFADAPAGAFPQDDENSDFVSSFVLDIANCKETQPTAAQRYSPAAQCLVDVSSLTLSGFTSRDKSVLGGAISLPLRC
jgi:hypothetical protein